MNNWFYTQPVDIIFGESSVSDIKNIVGKLGGTRGLLVSDPFFYKNGVAADMMKKSDGIIKTIYSEISPNPDVSEVDKCAEIIRKDDIDFVIAFGGGSAMDLAKAAATISLTTDSIKKYHGTGLQIPKEHLPTIAIPTTAGTGSEVTCVSVLTDKSNGRKSPIVSNGFYPEVAIIDPELTYSMPPYITACTGIDVLCHALEGYWSKGNQPICDALAIYALDIIFKYLYRAYKNGEDKEARQKMCEASVIAGLAFTLPKTTSSHACSFPLTNLYKIPHGEACALTLDFFTRVNKIDRVNELAKKLGFADVDGLADKILELKKCMNLKIDLKEFDLTDKQIDEIVNICHHPNLYNNPVEITDKMLYELFNGMR